MNTFSRIKKFLLKILVLVLIILFFIIIYKFAFIPLKDKYDIYKLQNPSTSSNIDLTNKYENSYLGVSFNYPKSLSEAQTYGSGDYSKDSIALTNTTKNDHIDVFTVSLNYEKFNPDYVTQYVYNYSKSDQRKSIFTPQHVFATTMIPPVRIEDVSKVNINGVDYFTYTYQGIRILIYPQTNNYIKYTFLNNGPIGNAIMKSVKRIDGVYNEQGDKEISGSFIGIESITIPEGWTIKRNDKSIELEFKTSKGKASLLINNTNPDLVREYQGGFESLNSIGFGLNENRNYTGPTCSYIASINRSSYTLDEDYHADLCIIKNSNNNYSESAYLSSKKMLVTGNSTPTNEKDQTYIEDSMARIIDSINFDQTQIR